MDRNAGAREGRAFRAGLRELERHRPDLALKLLRAAVDACPAADSGLLSSRLYWLAVALLRLDRPELAVKSLASAQKLRPRGMARKAYRARVNDYGMPRRGQAELDDFHAFYAIHACRYLAARKGGRFGDHGEKDAVTRLIALAWKELRASGRLKGRDAAARLAVFRAWPLSLPSFVDRGDLLRKGAGPSARGDGSCPDPLPVDFRRGRVLGPEDRCSCGSGLPWRLCCGRTTSPCEITPGR